MKEEPTAAAKSKTEQWWDQASCAGDPYTKAPLGITRGMIQEYIEGKRSELPGIRVSQLNLLQETAGKAVLCLASGGGHQSVAFSLLGAKVTVFDLCQGQLREDETAARHYGYEVRTVKGDMCDLSGLADESFDLVYHPLSINYTPEVASVFREVYRILRPGGIYSFDFMNPAVLPSSFFGRSSNNGDREISRVVVHIAPEWPEPETVAGEINPPREYRHEFRDVFGGLLEQGFIIRRVGEIPSYIRAQLQGEQGSTSEKICLNYLHLNVTVEKPRV
jgi:ubiquinone/menaquinone biosynthesis C-methylase UbiE